MLVYLIRHGSTKGNKEGRYVGATDEELSSAADEELRNLASLLASEKLVTEGVSKVYVSPMKRARQTATAVFPNAEQLVVDNLREMDFGKFEYKNFKELDGDPDYQEFIDTNCESQIPGGEKKADFTARTVAAFSEIVRSEATFGADAVFIVTHGGSVMSILATYDEEGKDFYEYMLKNGGCYRAEVSAGDTIVLRKVTKL